jgi:hypothetical protein
LREDRLGDLLEPLVDRAHDGHPRHDPLAPFDQVAADIALGEPAHGEREQQEDQHPHAGECEAGQEVGQQPAGDQRQDAVVDELDRGDDDPYRQHRRGDDHQPGQERVAQPGKKPTLWRRGRREGHGGIRRQKG